MCLVVSVASSVLCLVLAVALHMACRLCSSLCRVILCIRWQKCMAGKAVELND